MAVTEIFTVPQAYAGKSLSDIRRETPGTVYFSPGLIAQQTGIPETQKLTAGQTFTLTFPDVGSAEYQWLKSAFGAPTTPTGQVLERQKAEEETLFQRFEEARAGQEPLPAAYERLVTEAGVPGVREQLGAIKGQIFSVRDLLDRLEEDITARTTGTLTTEAQRRRLLAAEEAPLRTQLGRLATGAEPFVEQLTTALGDVATRLGLVSQQRAEELEPIRMRLAAFSDRAAREMTGFTQERQNELTLLLDKLDRERALSDREWQQASDLAASEAEWENTKEQLELEHGYAVALKAAPTGAGGVGGGGGGTAQYYGGYETTPTTGTRGLPRTPAASPEGYFVG